MFVYCDECNYETGDRDSFEELEKIVAEDGGKLSTISVCPKCKNEESLSID